MGSTINLTNSPSNQGAAEPAFNYEEQICKAIDIILKKRFADLKFNKTIFATNRSNLAYSFCRNHNYAS